MAAVARVAGFCQAARMQSTAAFERISPLLQRLHRWGRGLGEGAGVRFSPSLRTRDHIGDALRAGATPCSDISCWSRPARSPQSSAPGKARGRGSKAAFLATLLAVPAIASAAAETYRFDPVHTQVWFSADHQHFSHPLGRLRVKEGWFQFDAKDWSASHVDVTIDLAAADMGDEKWNAMVKSGQFLDTERWPTARYISSRVEKKTDTGGVIHGDLYFRGDKKPVDVNFTLNRVATDPYLFKQKAGFSATATLQRSVFGMKRYAEVVGENIELRLEIEGIRDGDAAKSSEQEGKDGAQK
ncbi:MAG: YceI family protein [Dokdonella sp.]